MPPETLDSLDKDSLKLLLVDLLAQNKALTEQISVLLARIAELEARNGQRLGIDGVIAMTCAQQLEEVAAALGTGGAEPSKMGVADLRAEAVGSLVASRSARRRKVTDLPAPKAPVTRAKQPLDWPPERLLLGILVGV
jgi:hypothetical protein